MFIDNAVEKNLNAQEIPHDLENIKEEVKGIKSLVICMETANLTIELMKKHARQMVVNMNKDKVHQLIQLH